MKNLEIKKILVPMDFSNNSIVAFDTAVAMAKRHDAQIQLLHVFDTDNNLYPESNLHNRHLRPGDIIRALEELATTSKATELVPCEIDYINGPVTVSILQKAIEKGTDLIVMGKNGHSGERDRYAGSHTYDVIKKSHCPVLVVPGNKVHKNFDNILFPVRSALSVLEKYNVLRSVFMRSNGYLHLLGVTNHIMHDGRIISKLMNLLKRSTDEDRLDTKVSYCMDGDDFADCVLKAASGDKHDFDLVVITAELDDSVREFYLGEYAQQIIHRSKVPTIVIRASAGPLPKHQLINVLEAATPVF